MHDHGPPLCHLPVTESVALPPQNKLADFVETENIAYFKTLLDTETDPVKRATLKRLLTDEEDKHAARTGAARKT